MSRIIDLGKLRFHFRGDWAAETLYELNDMVAYGACMYLYTYGVKETGAEPTEGSHWQLVVKGMRFVAGGIQVGAKYLLGDVVSDGASSRVALDNFTSAGSFAADTAEKWGLVALGQASVPDPLVSPNNMTVVTKDGAYGLRAPRDLVKFFNHLTANTLTEDGDECLCDTSLGKFAVTLPANPQGGEKVTIHDVAGSFAVAPITLKGNGKQIDGFSTDVQLDIPGETIVAIYINHALQWRLL